MKFYVYNNLRSQQDKMKSELFRFDDLKEAIAKFNELPKEWTTAIGGTVNGISEIDFVHRRNGEAVLINDYQNIPVFNEHEEMNSVLDELKKSLKIHYEMLGGIHPNTSVLSELREFNEMDSYFENKSLNLLSKETAPFQVNDHFGSNVVNKSGSSFNELINFSAVNEVYVEDKGWMTPIDFINLNKDFYENSYVPKVKFLNISYKDLNNGTIGQADISPKDYLQLKETTLLREAVNDKDESVRWNAAKSLKCPADVLMILSEDESPIVREAVAKNPNCLEEVLVDLTADEDERVYKTAEKALESRQKGLDQVIENCQKIRENFNQENKDKSEKNKEKEF